MIYKDLQQRVPGGFQEAWSSGVRELMKRLLSEFTRISEGIVKSRY